MKIDHTKFRKDFDTMWRNTDILNCRELSHTPFIVLDEKNGITLCKNAPELVRDFSPSTIVLIQWRGQWKSDFILLDVGDVILALKENDENNENS